MNATMYDTDQHIRRQAQEQFDPIIHLPVDYEVLDLSRESSFESSLPPEVSTPRSPYQVGRFNEVRSGLYTHSLFQQTEEPRCVHMGIDIGAPINTEVFSFDQGVIYAFGALSAPGDYGHTIITEHIWRSERPLPCGEECIQHGQTYWALYGHLSASSIKGLSKQTSVERGQRIGWIGSPEENGGWTPHLHFQLSRARPLNHDMPGVVTLAGRAQALSLYPDPRAVLGALY